MSFICWCLLIVITVIVLVTLACYLAVEFYAFPRVFKSIEKLPENEFGLVLGTSPVLKDGRPNKYFLRRMDAAISLYKAGKVHRLILSGDKHDGYDEPAAMKSALVTAGVPSEDCLLDGRGYDTIDSIRNAKEVFGAQGITVISQDFHCERAVLLAGFLGIRAVAYEAEEVESFWNSKTKYREILARVKLFKDIILLKIKRL